MIQAIPCQPVMLAPRPPLEWARRSPCPCGDHLGRSPSARIESRAFQTLLLYTSGHHGLAHGLGDHTSKMTVSTIGEPWPPFRPRLGQSQMRGCLSSLVWLAAKHPHNTDMAAACPPGQLISLDMFFKHVSGRLSPLYCIVPSKNARYHRYQVVMHGSSPGSRRLRAVCGICSDFWSNPAVCFTIPLRHHYTYYLGTQ